MSAITATAEHAAALAADAARHDSPVVMSSGSLDVINQVVTSSIAGWKLSARNRRLSASALHYLDHDFDFMHLLGLECDCHAHGSGSLAAIAALEPLPGESGSRHPILLHGLYVRHALQRTGTGSALLRAAEAFSRELGHDAIALRAWPESTAFFLRHGYARPCAGGADERLWKTLHE